MNIVIIDYGGGNIRSVVKAIEHCGVSATVSSERDIIQEADILVLPGQGAFEDAMKALRTYDLVDVITQHLASGKPYFGVCLGLQLLFDSSEENGSHKGLGIFKGRVRDFRKAGIENTLKIPHMGWNTVDVNYDPLGIYSGYSHKPYAYFVHTYYVDTEDSTIISSTTSYGVKFVSSIQSGNIFATQFHPEKSSDFGQFIIRAFFNRISS